jgi:spore germination protein GerM
VQFYWLKQTSNTVALVPIPLTGAGGAPNVQLEAGLKRLLTGPANTDVSSAIPEGTQLNSVKVQADGVHIDLSREFTTGGGSASMQGRLGQLIYTASSLNPNTKVWISIAGEPLRVLGGEGLEVPHPITRQDFDREFQL